MFTLYHLYFRFPEIEVQVAFSTGEIVGNSKEQTTSHEVKSQGKFGYPWESTRSQFVP